MCVSESGVDRCHALQCRRFVQHLIFFIPVIYTIDIFITPFILFLTPSSSLPATLPYILTHSPSSFQLASPTTYHSVSLSPNLPPSIPLTPSLPLCSCFPRSLACNQRAAKPSLLHSGIIAGLYRLPQTIPRNRLPQYVNVGIRFLMQSKGILKFFKSPLPP